MTWLAHQCHYCGHRSKNKDWISTVPGTTRLRYQCKWEVRKTCQARRDALSDRDRIFLDILGLLPPTRQGGA